MERAENGRDRSADASARARLEVCDGGVRFLGAGARDHLAALCLERLCLESRIKQVANSWFGKLSDESMKCLREKIKKGLMFVIGSWWALVLYCAKGLQRTRGGITYEL